MWLRTRTHAVPRTCRLRRDIAPIRFATRRQRDGLFGISVPTNHAFPWTPPPGGRLATDPLREQPRAPQGHVDRSSRPCLPYTTSTSRRRRWGAHLSTTFLM